MNISFLTQVKNKRGRLRVWSDSRLSGNSVLTITAQTRMKSYSLGLSEEIILYIYIFFFLDS